MFVGATCGKNDNGAAETQCHLPFVGFLLRKSKHVMDWLRLRFSNSPILRLTAFPKDTLRFQLCVKTESVFFWLLVVFLPNVLYICFFFCFFAKTCQGDTLTKLQVSFFFIGNNLELFGGNSRSSNNSMPKVQWRVKSGLVRYLGYRQTLHTWCMYVFFWEAQFGGEIKVQAKSSRAKRLGQT